MVDRQLRFKTMFGGMIPAGRAQKDSGPL